MSYTRIFIHFIWSTKNREELITKDLKPLLLEHIKANAKKKQIFIDTINCVEDHIHLLVSLGREQTVSKTAQLLKGESSHWMNAKKLSGSELEWQDEYIAVSVSKSAEENVRKYIRNQIEHHKTKSFSEEYELFLKKYGFDKS